MTLDRPFAPELVAIAKKVVWYDAPEQTLEDLPTFLSHLMVFGSPRDLATAQRFIPEEEFRAALKQAPAGVFTQEAWDRWHQRFGLPAPPLPRRRFPDGTLGPEPGTFFGR
jgi:hypothetical protein